MEPTPTLSSSLEGIHYQNGDAFRQIQSCIERLRDYEKELEKPKSKKARKAIEDSQLVKTIYDLFGLNVHLNIWEMMDPNAAVMPPSLDRNHPLFNWVQQEVLKEKDATKRIRKSKEKLYGEIDLRNAQVSGLYSEIVSELYISYGLLFAEGDKDEFFFSDEEITAVVCHELGHLMTYYEYLGRNVIVSQVLGDLSKEFVEADSHKKKLEIARVAKSATDSEALEPETLAEVDGQETFQIWVVSTIAQDHHHLTKTAVYDFRNSESLADQFVSRLGGARAMVTGLDKIHRATRGVVDSRAQWWAEITIEIFGTLRFTLFTCGIYAVLIIITFFTYPYETYDPPKERMDKIRRDFIGRMKNERLPKEERQRLKESYDVIEPIINRGLEAPSILFWIWKYVMPHARKQTKRAEAIQQLERLAHNKLFVKANELGALEN